MICDFIKTVHLLFDVGHHARYRRH